MATHLRTGGALKNSWRKPHRRNTLAQHVRVIELTRMRLRGCPPEGPGVTHHNFHSCAQACPRRALRITPVSIAKQRHAKDDLCAREPEVLT